MYGEPNGFRKNQIPNTPIGIIPRVSTVLSNPIKPKNIIPRKPIMLIAFGIAPSYPSPLVQ